MKEKKGTKKTEELTFKFEDPGLTDKEKQFLIKAMKSQVVAVLAARSSGKMFAYPQFSPTVPPRVIKGK